MIRKSTLHSGFDLVCRCCGKVIDTCFTEVSFKGISEVCNKCKDVSHDNNEEINTEVNYYENFKEVKNINTVDFNTVVIIDTISLQHKGRLIAKSNFNIKLDCSAEFNSNIKVILLGEIIRVFIRGTNL